MKRLLLTAFSLWVCLAWAPAPHAQEVDGSDLERQLIERQERVNKLSLEDQLKLRAAQQKAAQDPEVRAAMEKRDQAIREFRAAVRAAMLKADPSLVQVLEKIAMKDPSALNR